MYSIRSILWMNTLWNCLIKLKSEALKKNKSYGHTWQFLKLLMKLVIFQFLGLDNYIPVMHIYCKQRLETYLWKWGWFIRLWIMHQGEAVVFLKLGAEKVCERASYPLKSHVEQDWEKRRGMAVLHCRHLEDKENRILSDYWGQSCKSES